MAASVIPKVKRDGLITLTDGTSTYTVSYEDGDLSFDKTKTSRVVIRDRGVIVGVRKGEDAVLSLSFSVHMRDFTDATSLNLIDVLDNTGAASTWTTTGGSGFEQFMLTTSLTVEGDSHGDTADAVATFSKCLYEWSFSEGDPNKVSCKAEIYGGITFTGQA